MKSQTQNVTLAIPVTGNLGLQSPVNPHFGKSKAFVVADSHGSQLTYMEADAIRLPSECAPIEGLKQRGVRVLLCKGMGKGALQRSHQAGLQIELAEGNTVGECIDSFNAGQRSAFPDESICHSGHDHCHSH